MEKEKLPAIHLYIGDWLRDHIADCSLAAQGLWLRIMFIMHDSERYGYLCRDSLSIPLESIARRCGCTPDQFNTLFAELTSAGVPSKTPEGIIYSRRMVRDAEIRQIRSKSGKQGGRFTSIKRCEGKHKAKLRQNTDTDNDNDNEDDKTILLWFEELWSKYPNKDGKKQALGHFKASVTSKELYEKCSKALDNYLKSDRVKNGYIKNGSTWFSNWQDWIDYIENNKEKQPVKPPLYTDTTLSK